MNNRVKNSRKEFVERFSRDTLKALARLAKAAKGRNVDVSNRSYAAYLANLNRGAYAPYVEADFKRDTLDLLSVRN